jgi:Rrf2 family protein
MLTQKTRYSMLAITRLAKEFGKGTLMINEIATSEKIPKRFLESILLELKKTGYLGSKLGKKGGYYLIKNPKEVSLLEIIRLFEGSVALLPCTSKNSTSPANIVKTKKPAPSGMFFWMYVVIHSTSWQTPRLPL